MTWADILTGSGGPPVTTLEAIDLAGKVGDLAVVDIAYPFNPPGLPVSQVAEALERNSLRAIGITPEISTREFCRGAMGGHRGRPALPLAVARIIAPARPCGSGGRGTARGP